MAYTSYIRRGRTCVSALHVHLVFVAKYRRKVMTARVVACLTESFRSVAADLGFTVAEVDADMDHVHLLVHYPPKLSVSAMVNALKGVSSHYLRAAGFKEVRRALSGRHFWSPSYYAGSCGGAPLDTIADYVRSQSGKTPKPKRP